ncbi:OVARIAN TUMOR DOMAIN-containing deubiquitinating enzyme 11-like isoform X3 [Lycium barbarum]|uniref:OVARIAN TUMOR DOMAIN-containing deubiquitinating enzyme 11-like isoform X3 n=1 Tax=Lycium barbarum TaxID=112863 RepID=UPI00293E12B8|nr:OVARIAN TUMOR DOMAIN-containing deubiquitinating enzyme 11-like isoform X3 [Lycium barbarum]
MSEHYGNSRASSSSASSLNSSSQGTEDDHTIAKILAEEEENVSRYGANKLGKRLSHLDSIPHTPRVIGQIPDPNDATLDHGRLSGRLAAYGLAEFQIQGDGNCQFRALADQLYHNPEFHKHVRKEVVKQYGVKICLVTSFRENGYIEILPKDIQPSRELWLSFWSEVHYNSLYEIGEVPARVRRKKHWLF